MNSPEGRDRFQVGRCVREGVHGREKASYRPRFELGLLLALGSMVLLFGFLRRIPHRWGKDVGRGVYLIFAFDPIPLTKQGGIPRPPNLPQVPIPTEDEYLPEDETVDSTRLVLTEGIPLFDARREGEGGVGGMGARPIREVIPEYPEEVRDRGVEGVVELAILVNPHGGVDSVRVVQNTTRSRRLERAAIEAAYRSRYFPAERDGKRVSLWIRRPYRFERR